MYVGVLCVFGVCLCVFCLLWISRFCCVVSSCPGLLLFSGFIDISLYVYINVRCVDVLLQMS